MKKLLILIGAIAAYGQTVSISDTLTNAVGGGSYAGRIVVTLNSPGSASPLYYSSTSLTGWQYVLCVGVTGTDCSSTTAAGVVTLTLYANSTITPAGTSYSARFTPSKGSPWTETWVVTPSTTTLRQVRSSTVPTPTTTFQSSQLALAAGSMVYGSSAGVGTALAAGSNGQVLALSGGYPAWTTNIAGNAGTATALAANGTNCAAGTFPLGVDASGNSESCTALPTTISGTANQITASAATGAITLSLPATITGLTSVTSTGFTGALTGNASTATALSSTVASGRLWIGAGTGVPTSDANLFWDSANAKLGVGTNAPTAGYRQTIVASDNGGEGGLIVHPANLSQYMRYNWANIASSSFLDIKTNGTASVVARFNTTGNLLIGTTTDGNYKLDVANSGSTGTLRVYDQTATTGVTKAVIRAGAGQSTTNLMEWQDNSGVVAGAITSAGNILELSKSSVNGMSLGFGGIAFGSGIGISWASGASTAAKDSGVSRAAAGYVKVTDGSTGLGKIVVSQTTPSASSDACTAGALWADATYIYACTASGTIKRATLATF